MAKLFHNGRIYSIDDTESIYEAVGIKDGKIVFLGTNDEAAKAEAAEKVDLSGKTVLPGFVDSHLHMLNYAFVKAAYEMFGVKSVEEVVETGKKLAAEMDEATGKWMYGRGWNEESFDGEKRPLTRFDLDRISREIPILFIRVCGHKAAVNTKALKIIMDLEQTKDYIEQIDQENGILTEASVKLCYNAMQEPTVEEIKDMILTAQRDINAAGITGVETDNFLSLPGRNSERIMKAYRELEEEGLLTLRIREQASFTAYDHMKEFIDKGYRTGDGGEYYTIGPVKLYEDGSLGARTALMNSPSLGTDTYGTAVLHPEKSVDAEFKDTLQRIAKNTNRFEYGETPDAESLAQTEALLAFCARAGIEVTAFLPPYAPSVWQRMQETEQYGYISATFAALETMFARYGFEVFDYSYLPETNDSQYVDGFHGSDRVYAALCARLAEDSLLLGAQFDSAALTALFTAQGNPLTVSLP